MIIDIERYIDLLIKLNIVESQFTFLWLTLHKKYSLMYKYLQEKGGFKPADLKDLEEKGYVEYTRDGTERDRFYQDSFEVTKKFTDMLFTDKPDEAFDQFWNSYPNFLFIESKRIPTKACNMECLGERYVKMIKGNLQLHYDIMETVAWGKERGYLTMGIMKFYESEAWNYLRSEINASKESGELPSDQFL